ncbi:hypothetical protein ACFQS7_29695 [Dankookia sp. GCM10030260]|uniref:hypothetical protein n=1 Tax=Dankookia sp. GCM10030260 TaxID=3273390 RepID=UPI00361B5910
MADPVEFLMPNGTRMRGFATTGTEIERVVLLHDMGRGPPAEEVVWRAIVPPEPEAAAPEVTTPEAPAQ